LWLCLVSFRASVLLNCGCCSTGSFSCRKSWDTSRGFCCGTAVAKNKKMLRGHIWESSYQEIIVHGGARKSKLQLGEHLPSAVSNRKPAFTANLHLLTLKA